MPCSTHSIATEMWLAYYFSPNSITLNSHRPLPTVRLFWVTKWQSEGPASSRYVD
uniref:Uncharacterized protein n=1 Tax=Anguilla anguilla TaxID=7936 RepID=A0A0E9UXD2_ANGAN